MTNKENQLSYLDDQDRLNAYTAITQGAIHLWTKGKLNKEKLSGILATFMELAEKDPLFLAHFTSYAIKHLDSKDLKVISVFANSLNDADGTPFSASSAYRKPNLRAISQAAIQDASFDAKLVERLIEIANMKQPLGSKYKEGTHFSRSLKTAIRKYIRYREANPKALEGVKKVGLGNRFKNLYRAVRIAPSIEAATILGWNQKIGGKVQKKKFFDFKGMSELEIAEKIRAEKLPPTGVLGALPNKISPVIAAAILEQATGNQAVILRELFDSQGLLKHKEVQKVFAEKIRTAKTALDRVERINTEIDEDIQKELKKAKAEVRKEQVGDIGKICLHIDISGSMSSALEIAKDKGAIIAECVKNPENNFFWGTFNTNPEILPRPKTFEKDAFSKALYGIKSGGGTDCLALYPYARQNGCTVDVIVTDGQHLSGDIPEMIKYFDKKGLPRPQAVVIVRVGTYHEILKNGLEAAGIPVSVIKPEALTESALVAQAIKTAMKGASAVIDEVMNTPLLKLPAWWESV